MALAFQKKLLLLNNHVLLVVSIIKPIKMGIQNLYLIKFVVNDFLYNILMNPNACVPYVNQEM